MRKLVVLGISGSPRKGNSQFLLDKALEAARNADPDGVECVSYSIRGKKIGPCMSCFRCGEQEGECVIKDGFQELRDLWLKADVIIYSIPVYHMGIPGQMKCFIDRLGNSLFGRYQGIFEPGEGKLPKLLKVVGSIVQGVHLCAGQEHTLTNLINHTLIMQCIPVTGDMWQSYIGGGGWTSNDIDRKALENQLAKNNYDASIAVKSAQDIGKRATELALLIRAGGYSRKKELSRDPIYKPFLDRLR
ncbi:MAG: hypothetical protein GH145_01155 [Firmicutes bacterium]|jgi:multimeric flavodoxin WrbA|nr:hypothetical protein [Bacillota bacterium]